MEKPNGNKGGHFLLGILLGVSLGLLVGTNRGRKILSEAANLGMEVLDEVLEEKTVENKSPEEKVAPEESRIDSQEQGTQKPHNGEPKKRLFRGIRRK